MVLRTICSTTTLLATMAPVIIAPAMNIHMYAHPAVRQNINILHDRGVQFMSRKLDCLLADIQAKGGLQNQNI